MQQTIPSLSGLQDNRRAGLSVPGTFIKACAGVWRSYDSLREAAERISVLSTAERNRRRAISGHPEDVSGLCVSYQTIAKLDQQVRGRGAPPATMRLSPTIYFLLCAWMGVAPSLPQDRRDPLHAFYRVWRLHYDIEQRRKEANHNAKEINLAAKTTAH